MSDERCTHGWRGAPAEPIANRCPCCGAKSLFIAEGGWVTCGNLSCRAPDEPTARLEKRSDALSSIPDPAALVEAARRVVGSGRAIPQNARPYTATTWVVDASAFEGLRTALNPEEPHDGD